MADELDNIHDFEAKDTSKKLPWCWQLRFWSLILWGIYYTAAHTPMISGWSQERAYTESLKP
jgi:hypothetical protein